MLALTVVLVVKLEISGISPLASFILALWVVSVTKLVTGILSSIVFVT